MTHYLYLVRHGEQQDAEHGLRDGPLSERGHRQAQAIAHRLRNVPFTGAWHSPLDRAEQTARVITELLPGIESESSALLFDCIPTEPTADMPAAFESFYGAVTQEETEAGRAQMADAEAEWLVPTREDQHSLLITHNFVIGWFVRAVLDAPDWRWLSLTQAHAALTVIRLKGGKPPVLVAFNDVGHLPPELRTGMSVKLLH